MFTALEEQLEPGKKVGRGQCLPQVKEDGSGEKLQDRKIYFGRQTARFRESTSTPRVLVMNCGVDMRLPWRN